MYRMQCGHFCTGCLRWAKQQPVSQPERFICYCYQRFNSKQFGGGAENSRHSQTRRFSSQKIECSVASPAIFSKVAGLFLPAVACFPAFFPLLVLFPWDKFPGCQNKLYALQCPAVKGLSHCRCTLQPQIMVL